MTAYDQPIRRNWCTYYAHMTTTEAMEDAQRSVGGHGSPARMVLLVPDESTHTWLSGVLEGFGAERITVELGGYHRPPVGLRVVSQRKSWTR